MSHDIARVTIEELDTTTMPTLDVRSHPHRQQIRGALRYDARALLTEEQLALPLPHEGRIVVYADDDRRAALVARRLHDQGFKHAAVLEGGFEAYEAAGLPTEEITQEQPIPGADGTGMPRL